MEEQTYTARTTLSKLELRCPPMPQTLMEAMALIDQPEKLEVGPVTDMVQRDPIVVARLLQIVNSAYYGLRHAISSAERAVVMLGPVAVAGIVVGMNMLKLRTVLDGPGAACFQKLIRHSVATAFLTRHILDAQHPASRKPTSRVDVGFTAGLLHDFGKIILVYNFPGEAVAFYEKQGIEQQVMTEDEREMEQLLFGCDHTEAGEYVARKLSFPDTLTDAIRFHHEPYQPTGVAETDRVIAAVAAANLATKAMGYALTQSHTWDECYPRPIWTELAEIYPKRYENTEALVVDLQAQQEHLDQYVHELTATTDLEQFQERLKTSITHRHNPDGDRDTQGQQQ